MVLRVLSIAAMALIAGAGTLAGMVTAGADWADDAYVRLKEGHLGLPHMASTSRVSPAAIALGRKIFFDRRLSLNGTLSCGMCHVPEQAFASNELATAVGFEGRTVKRNAPTLINIGVLTTLFHDGREQALETQFVGPLVAPNEMANPAIGRVIELLRTLPDYRNLFERAFAAEPSLDTVGSALAAYQRSLIGGPSRFDRWRYGGDSAALNAEEQRGYLLFTGKAGCSQCHSIGERHALFSDQEFHDTGYGWWRERVRQSPNEGEAVEVAPGVSYRLGRDVIDSVAAPPQADLGRYEVTLDPRDVWKFRTPSLRNVALTAPYMHDGALRTLAEVVAFYNAGGYPHEGQSPLIRPLGLGDGDVRALVAFLGTLTSSGLDRLVSEARVEPPDNW